MGNTECIYHIQFVMNISANIPAAYLDMVEEGQNDYTITSSTPFILLKYVSHIIPYTIKFDPYPSCIKYGNELPLPTNCTAPSQMPQTFRDSVVYFNISENLPTQKAIFKFSVYINSGFYQLTQDKPILISCEQPCYQLINVIVKPPNATILHSGIGHIEAMNTTRDVIG
jgi:hypothetical protein